MAGGPLCGCSLACCPVTGRAGGRLRPPVRMRLDIEPWSPTATALELIPCQRVRPSAANEMNMLTGVAEPAKLQILVRVGRTSQPGLSPRRDLSAIAQPR